MIVPNVPVPLTSADYFAGRDPVMDTTLKLIASSSVRATEQCGEHGQSGPQAKC